MNKDNRLQLVAIYKPAILLFCLLLMVVGFFWARAVLSIGMIAFCVISIFQSNIKPALQSRYWLLGVLWILLLAITAFWSTDKDAFAHLFPQKIPILILPIAFAVSPKFSSKNKIIFTLSVCVLTLTGIGHSLWPLIHNSQEMISGYGKAQVLPTPVYGDYIRFSLFLALWCNWCFYLLITQPQIWLRRILYLFIALVMAYMHVLAARTGLVCLYLGVGIWLLYFYFSGYKFRVTVIMFMVALLGILALKYIPTLNTRFRYMKYTLEQWQVGKAGNNYSDVGRWTSIKAGAKTFMRNPLLGVGYGDVLAEVKKEYQKQKVSDNRNLYPHNEFVLLGAAGGIVVVLPFCAWVLLPFLQTRKSKKGIHLLSCLSMLLLLLLIEPALEVQMGVFVYLFFLLWALKELKDFELVQNPK